MWRPDWALPALGTAGPEGKASPRQAGVRRGRAEVESLRAGSRTGAQPSPREDARGRRRLWVPPGAGRVRGAWRRARGSQGAGSLATSQSRPSPGPQPWISGLTDTAGRGGCEAEARGRQGLAPPRGPSCPCGCAPRARGSLGLSGSRPWPVPVRARSPAHPKPLNVPAGSCKLGLSPGSGNCRVPPELPRVKLKLAARPADPQRGSRCTRAPLSRRPGRAGGGQELLKRQDCGEGSFPSEKALFFSFSNDLKLFALTWSPRRFEKRFLGPWPKSHGLRLRGSR